MKHGGTLESPDENSPKPSTDDDEDQDDQDDDS